MNLGERIKKAREDKKLTVSHVARKIGVSQSTYRDWEYGREIKGEPYIKIAEALGVSLTYVLGVSKTETEDTIKEIGELIEKLQNHVNILRSKL